MRNHNIFVHTKNKQDTQRTNRIRLNSASYGLIRVGVIITPLPVESIMTDRTNGAQCAYLHTQFVGDDKSRLRSGVEFIVIVKQYRDGVCTRENCVSKGSYT